MRRRFFGPWGLFVVLFVLFARTLVERHCYPDPRVLQQSQQQYWRRVPVKANRGIIQDSKGNALVIPEMVSSFAVDPKLLDSADLPALRSVFSEDVVGRLQPNGEGRFVWLKRKVSGEEAQKILALNIRAVRDIGEQERRYPNGSLLAHVLGFCDIDNRGQAGIEQSWNSVLYDPPGYRIIIRRPGAHSIGLGGDEPERSHVMPVVTLTVDSRMQYVVEKHLDKIASGNGAKWAAAICMDPWTGAILSMASWPPFDPRVREGFKKELLSNNAVSRSYEPGSTFKPIYMGIALEQGWVRTDETFHCPARLKVADGYVAEAYPRAMGNISTAQLIVKSSNVGMAQIGIRSEKVKMYETLWSWGFGSASDVELPGVASGILPFPEQWRGVVPANIAIGQGLAITPLQLVNAMAAIVNGGKLMSPYIVKEAVNSSGEVVYRGEPRVMREVLTPETAQWLRGTMRSAVLEGTGKGANTAITELAVAPLPLPTIRGRGTEVDALGLERYAKGVLGSLAIMGINRQLVEMRSRHRRMSPQDEGYREIFSQIAALEQRRMQIRQGA